MKPSPANITEYIHREIAKQSWDQETVINAGRALGTIEAKTSYMPRDFSYAFLMVCRNALKVFGTSKAERRPRGPLPWRLKLFEMWSAGELNPDSASQIVDEHAKSLAAKLKSPEPEPPKKKTWACSGTMGREFRIEHSTAVALCKAVEHMNDWTCGFLGGEHFCGDRVNGLVNEVIRAAAEAVTHFVPNSPLRFRAPFVFKARDETNAEREMRLMLEALSK